MYGRFMSFGRFWKNAFSRKCPRSVWEVSGTSPNLFRPMLDQFWTGLDQKLPHNYISKIITNKKNPRKIFDKNQLEELKESIYQHGILQPLTVREIEDGKYELIAGGRRFEAMLQLSKEYADDRFTKVPIFVKAIESDSLMTELALIENLQRSNLNPIEEAIAFNDLKTNYSMSDQQIADSIGKSRSSISNSIRLLNFNQSKSGQIIIEALKKSEVTVGQVRPLIDLKPATQASIFKKIKSKNLSARQVEKEVKKYYNYTGKRRRDQSLRKASRQ